MSTTDSGPSLALWHCRLGHLNYTYVNQLVKKEMVDGMNCDPDSQPKKECEACVLGKMQKKPFPNVQFFEENFDHIDEEIKSKDAAQANVKKVKVLHSILYMKNLQFQRMLSLQLKRMLNLQFQRMLSLQFHRMFKQ